MQTIALGIVVVLSAQGLDDALSVHACNQVVRNLCLTGENGSYKLWAKENEKNRLIEPMFVRFDKNGKPELIVWAREAKIQVNLKQRRAYIWLMNANGVTMDGTAQWYFEHRVFPVDWPAFAEPQGKAKGGAGR